MALDWNGGGVAMETASRDGRGLLSLQTEQRCVEGMWAGSGMHKTAVWMSYLLEIIWISPCLETDSVRTGMNDIIFPEYNPFLITDVKQDDVNLTTISGTDIWRSAASEATCFSGSLFQQRTQKAVFRGFPHQILKLN